MNRIVVTLLLFSFSCFQSLAQNKSIRFNDVTIKEALAILEKEYPGHSFAYNENLDELNKKVNKTYTNKSLDHILSNLLSFKRLKYKRYGKKIVIYKKKKRQKKAEKFTVSGYVYDKESGETLVGCSVYTSDYSIGTTTNNYGFYSLTLSKGENNIYVSYIGYDNKKEKLLLDKDLRHHISIEPSNVELAEVRVKSHYKTKERVYAGVTSISPKEIKEIPLPFGEPDILKAAQIQNGVKTISDGSSAYYVRGGNRDQNLVIVDEANLYNPSHVLGIVSVINHEVVKNADFYKGYIPAKYSGMASSVMDIATKEGNLSKMGISGGISTLGARALVEGPLVKDKLSYMVSGRMSWLSLMTKNAPEYYDINSKLHWKASENNKFFLSLYHGKDMLTGEYNGTRWTNTLANLRWNHVFNGKMFLNNSLVFNRFNGVDVTDNQTSREWENGINEIQLKSTLDYYINDRNKFTTSLQFGKHKFVIGRFMDRSVDLGTRDNLSLSAAVTHNLKITDDLSVEYGINYKRYSALGPTDQLILDENYETVSFEKSNSGSYKSWNSFEPRLNVNYNINDHHRVFASYSRLAQFVHSLNNYSNDYEVTRIWVPVSNNIKPIKTNMYSVGYGFHKGGLSINIDGFFKSIENQLDYVTYPDLYSVEFERFLRSGNARAYGVELGVGYQSEKWKLQADYSYSRVFLTVDGINGGREYVAPYDIPHQINLSALYKMNKRWNFSAIWKYSSGRPFTLPVAQHVVSDGFNSYSFPLFGNRYNARGKDYHRLDLMATLLPNPDKNKQWKGTWKFGVSNAYGRKNPIAYSYDFNGYELGTIEYSIMGFMPMLEYSFTF